MANTDLMFQCKLSNGNTFQVAYIPERGATVGKIVEIVPGSKDFWTVDSVAFPGIPRARVSDIQQNYHKGFASLK